MVSCPSCHSTTGSDTRTCPECGEALPIGAGSVIDGRYEVMARLGAGGMGTVFRALDRDLDQFVALKVLRLGPSGQPLERFKAEIKLARKVKHPNVCAVWQNGYDGEFAYIVMELVEGRTLRELIREQGCPSWDEVCHLTLQAAEGLAAIHEAGIIHRDVKTSNVMIDGRGVVRVVDFGIARGDPANPPPDLTTESRRLTDAHHVVGSPAYMSPEQICGGAVDPRSDLYSLGIVLYELFTGRLPFEGESAADVMLKHLYEDVVLEGAAVANVPPVALPILGRALAKNPAARYQTARSLISDLRRARARLDSPDSEPRTYSEIFRQTPMRSRFFWGLGGSMIAGLAALGLLKGMLAPGPPVVDAPEHSVPMPSAVPPSSPPTTPPAAVAAPTPVPTPPLAAASSAGDRSPVRSLRPKPPQPEPKDDAARASPVPPPPPKRDAPNASRERMVAPRDDEKGVAGERVTEEAPAPEMVPAPTPVPTPTADPKPGPSRGELFRFDDPEVVAPTCLSCPVAYPMIAERLKIEGDVEIKILVDEEGRVVEALVLSGHKDLRNEAATSVRKWIYRAATKRGVPGKMWLIVTVRFELSERPR